VVFSGIMIPLKVLVAVWWHPVPNLLPMQMVCDLRDKVEVAILQQVFAYTGSEMTADR
jgi:hypothetical protein